MEKETAIEDKKFTIGWKTFGILLVSLLSFTNAGNYLIFQQGRNTEQIKYDNEANKRRIKHTEREFDYKLKIMTLETDIKNLKQEKIELAEDIDEWKQKYQELKEQK